MNKITVTSISVPSGTNPDTSNSDTITAMKTSLQKANPSLSSSDLANLIFADTTLVASQGVSAQVIAVIGSSIASKDITVTLGGGGPMLY